MRVLENEYVTDIVNVFDNFGSSSAIFNPERRVVKVEGIRSLALLSC